MLQDNLFIAGKAVPSCSGETRTVTNPATGKVLAHVAEGNAEDIHRAVESAHQAFSGGSWRALSSRERTRVLLRLGDLVRDEREPLAQLESQNVGKPIRESRDEISLAADCFEYYAGAVNKVGGQTIPVAAAGLSLTLREPLGVCGLILPWNFPLVIASWKVAPALAMGNAIVLKPAEQTPLTALRLGQLALEAGVPPGILNIVPGAGEVAGEALVRHPQVSKISFTGSTLVGIRVMKLAADNVKPVALELGGKSANIVFSDADMEQALEGATWSVLGNAGQDCCARSRLLVERPIFDEFVQKLVQRFQEVKMGEPLEDTTELGPLISTAHRARVLWLIERGKNEGARLLCGGHSAEGPRFNSGAFLHPTIFADVHPDMAIMTEEIFGPVLCAMPFEDEEEAVRIANQSIYGLSGSIWTRDITRALRVARSVETGVISINTGHSVHLEAPFGGVKKSGIGKELGLAALEHYSHLKSVFIGG